jgi:DNA-binding transcriptional MocR family regulator
MSLATRCARDLLAKDGQHLAADPEWSFESREGDTGPLVVAVATVALDSRADVVARAQQLMQAMDHQPRCGQCSDYSQLQRLRLDRGLTIPEAAAQLGRSDFRRLMMFTSLSKRSNVPGLRSGFVAGDAELIKPYLLYRTYHGSAMSPAVQTASIEAWGDEIHVQDNRRLYREKFAQVTPMLAEVLDVALPDAAFYLWAGVPERFATHTPGLSADEAFARELLAQYNVTVLPGSYLAREAQGHNPGTGRVRLALVADTAECAEAAQRIVDFCRA